MVFLETAGDLPSNMAEFVIPPMHLAAVAPAGSNCLAPSIASSEPHGCHHGADLFAP